MTHGCVTGPGPGTRWESKAGAWLRLQHGLGEMEGGSLYGDVVGFYRRAALIAADLQQANLQLQTLLRAQVMKDVIGLGAGHLDYVKARAGRADRQLKEAFDAAYTAWKATWSHPLIAVSSARRREPSRSSSSS